MFYGSSLAASLETNGVCFMKEYTVHGRNSSGKVVNGHLEFLRKSDYPKWDPKDDGIVGKTFVQCVEEVARAEAERIGFDMEKESHALMRMIMTVFSSQDLRSSAVDLLKEKLESVL